jgi:hypothetical protein
MTLGSRTANTDAPPATICTHQSQAPGRTHPRWQRILRLR